MGRAIGDPSIVFWSMQALAVAAYVDGRSDDAIAIGVESMALATAMGWRFARLSATMCLVMGHSAAGGDDSSRHAREGIALSEALGRDLGTRVVLPVPGGRPAATGRPRRGASRRAPVARDPPRPGRLRGRGPCPGDARPDRERDRSRRSGREDHRHRRGALGIDSGADPRAAPRRSRAGRARRARGARRRRVRRGVYRRQGAAPGRRDRLRARHRTPRRAREAEAARAPTPSDGLSRREREVATLVAGGSTNAQVAGSLFISERTVESHLASIFNKLGVDNRMQLARWVIATEAAPAS